MIITTTLLLRRFCIYLRVHNSDPEPVCCKARTIGGVVLLSMCCWLHIFSSGTFTESGTTLENQQLAGDLASRSRECRLPSPPVPLPFLAIPIAV